MSEIATKNPVKREEERFDTRLLFSDKNKYPLPKSDHLPEPPPWLFKDKYYGTDVLDVMRYSYWRNPEKRARMWEFEKNPRRRKTDDEVGLWGVAWRQGASIVPLLFKHLGTAAKANVGLGEKEVRSNTLAALFTDIGGALQGSGELAVGKLQTVPVEDPFGSVEGTAYFGTRALANAIGYIAPSLLVGLINPKLGVSVALGTGLTLGFGEIYDQSIKMGKSKEEALALARGGMVPYALLEYLSYKTITKGGLILGKIGLKEGGKEFIQKRLLTGLSKTFNTAGRITTKQIAVGLENAVQEAMQQGLVYGLGGTELTPEEMTKSLLIEGAAGFVAGFALGIPGSISSTLTENQVRQHLGEIEGIDKIIDAVLKGEPLEGEPLTTKFSSGPERARVLSSLLMMVQEQQEFYSRKQKDLTGEPTVRSGVGSNLKLGKDSKELDNYDGVEPILTVAHAIMGFKAALEGVKKLNPKEVKHAVGVSTIRLYLSERGKNYPGGRDEFADNMAQAYNLPSLMKTVEDVDKWIVAMGEMEKSLFPTTGERVFDFESQEGFEGVQNVYYNKKEGSRVEVEPFTHVGTLTSSITKMLHRGGTLRRGELNMKNPLRVLDSDEPRTPENLVEWVLETGVLSSEQEADLIRAFEQDQNYLLTMRRFLEAKGYDGIVYTNTLSDQGSDAFVVFRAEQLVTEQGERRKNQSFDDWFKGSKVKGVSGTPLFVTTFIASDSTGIKGGEIFHSDPMKVEQPASSKELSGFLAIRKPYRVYSEEEFAGAMANQEAMKKEGYDGIIFDEQEKAVPFYDWQFRDNLEDRIDFEKSPHIPLELYKTLAMKIKGLNPFPFVGRQEAFVNRRSFLEALFSGALQADIVVDAFTGTGVNSNVLSLLDTENFQVVKNEEPGIGSFYKKLASDPEGFFTELLTVQEGILRVIKGKEGLEAVAVLEDFFKLAIDSPEVFVLAQLMNSAGSKIKKAEDIKVGMNLRTGALQNLDLATGTEIIKLLSDIGKAVKKNNTFISETNGWDRLRLATKNEFVIVDGDHATYLQGVSDLERLKINMVPAIQAGAKILYSSEYNSVVSNFLLKHDFTVVIQSRKITGGTEEILIAYNYKTKVLTEQLQPLIPKLESGQEGPLSEEQAMTAMHVWDRIAVVWAQKNNKTVDEFYSFMANIKFQTDESYRKLTGKDAPNGYIEYMNEARSLITLLEDGDIVTLMHEFGHFFVRIPGMFTEVEMKQVRKYAGVKEGAKWTAENREIFAYAFEQYMLNNKLDPDAPEGVFQKLRDYLEALYQSARQLLRLSPEITATFDRILGADFGPLKAETSLVSPVYESDRPLGLKNEMDAAQQLERMLGEHSPIVSKIERYRTAEEIRNLAGVVSDYDNRGWFVTTAKSLVGSVWDFVVGDMLTRLRTPAGELLSIKLADAVAYKKELEGGLENQFHEVYRGLRKTKVGKISSEKWLMLFDQDGVSNLTLVIEGGLPAPNQAIQDYINLNQVMLDTTANEARRVGMLQHLRDGTYRLFKGSGNKKLRLMTWRALKAMTDQGGDLYESIIRQVVQLNNTMTEAQVRETMEEYFGPPSIRRVGSLEEARKIPKFPDFVKTRSGWVQILHTDPHSYWSMALERQALRIYFVEKFGQGVLEEAGFKRLAKLGKILGIQTQLNQSGLASRMTEEYGILIEDLTDPSSDQLVSMKKLRQIAKTHNVPTGVSSAEVATVMKERGIDNFTPSQLQALQEWIKVLPWINKTASDQEVFNEVQEYLRDPSDDLIDRLRSLHAKQGGDVNQFNDAIRVWFRRPYKWMGDHPWPRFVRFLSSLVGSIQTSLAVAPNLPQPFMQLPRYTGWKRTLVAYFKALAHPKQTISQLSAMGAMTRSEMVWRIRKGYGLEDVGRIIRGVTSRVTGLHWVSQLNNMVAGEAFTQLADDWAEGSFTRGDIPLAQQLRLSKEDIKGLLEQRISPHTKAKIIQGGINKTQFVTEHPSRQSPLQNWPFLNMLFAYNNYMLGTMRSTADLGKETLNAVRSKGREKHLLRAKAANKWFQFLIGSVGAGMAGMMLRRAIKGYPPKREDEDLVDLALGGLLEVQLLGPTQRVIDAYTFSDRHSVEKMMIGMMPQVKAVADMIGALLPGVGKYGDFPLEQRVGKTAIKHAPAIRSLLNWFDKEMYPEKQDYDKARAIVGKHIGRVLDRKKRAGSFPVNPEYDRIYQSVIRGDVKEAKKLAMELYRSEPEKMHKKIRGLHSSLRARAPLYLNEQDLLKVVGNMTEKERVFVLEQYRSYMRVVYLIAPVGGN